MLPTTAIKADSPVTSAGAGIKDKDAAALSLEATFSAYFSQMVAVLPSLDANMPSSQGHDAGPRAPAQPAEGGRKAPAPASSNLNANPDAAGASAQAASTAPAPAQPPQAAPQPAKGGNAGSAGQGQADAAATPAGSQASAAAPATAPPPAKPAQASAAPESAAPAAAAPVLAAVAADAQAQAAAKVQEALNQAVPGAQFQVQYGTEGAPATSKQPLSELVTPFQIVTGPSAAAAKASLPVTVPVAPAAAVDPAAMLQALQVSQTPQAAQTALLALPAPGTAVAGTALAGSAAAGAQAVSAGAQPGASGAVRVTASAGSGGSRPAGDPSLFSQVDGTIRWLVKNQDQGAELQLHPESLGRLQIKLKVEGSVVHAKVWASDAAAVPVLQEHRASLEASLKSQGLTLGSFDLQHGHRQQQAPLPDPSASLSVPAAGAVLAATGQESPVSMGQMASHTSRIEYVA